MKNLVEIVRKGILSGIQSALISGFVSPLILAAVNLFIEKKTLQIFLLPEVYCGFALASFALYLVPCCLVGVSLSFLSPLKNRISVTAKFLVSILLPLISSFFIWRFLLGSKTLEIEPYKWTMAFALTALQYYIFQKSSYLKQP